MIYNARGKGCPRNFFPINGKKIQNVRVDRESYLNCNPKKARVRRAW